MQTPSSFERHLRRRRFLQVAGASAALVLAGCGKDPAPAPTTPSYQFTGDDNGQLNYFYLLKQLLVAYYQQGLAANPTGLQPGELDVLQDLRDHHVVHLQTLYAALGNAPLIGAVGSIVPNPATSSTPTATYTFTGLTLNTRAGLLAGAQTLEDLTLAAFNYSVPLFSSVDLLNLLTKLTAAQARHAATVRLLLDPTTLAAPDVAAVVNPADGLAATATPTATFALISPYISGITIDVSAVRTA